MTSNEQSILFELISAAIWQRKPQLEHYIDGSKLKWKNIYRAIETNALKGVVADVIMSLPVDLRPNAKIQMNLMAYVGGLTQTRFALDASTALVFDAMHKHGLHPVLMKGQVLAQYYPERVSRPCGDIDVYVSPHEYDRACDIANDLCGFRDKREGLFEDRVHYHAKLKSGIVVEVHRRVGETPDPEQFDTFNNWADGMLQWDKCRTMVINGVEIHIPSDRFILIFTYQHLAKHLASKGIGLRQFVDWAMIMHAFHGNDSAFWNDIRKDMKMHIRMKPWQILSGILVYQMGLPVEECLYWDEKQARKSQGELLEYITDSGNFGEANSWSDIISTMDRGLKRYVVAVRYLIGHARMLSKLSWKWAYNYLRIILTARFVD